MIDQNRTRSSELSGQLRPFIQRRIASAADVDDVLQEVLLRIHQGLPELEQRERIGPWIYRVTRNAIADHYRTRTRSPLSLEGHSGGAQASSEGVLDPDSLTPESGVVDRDVGAELAAQLGSFVEALPEPYRATLRLTELEGKKQHVAAAELGISLAALKARVRRGRQLLKRSLEACCALAVDARGRLIECAPRADGVAPPGCCKS